MSELKQCELEQSKEINIKARKGMPFLLLNIMGIILSIINLVYNIINLDVNGGLGGILIGMSIFYWFVPMILLFKGLKVIRPNEAMVFTLFGKYIGTLKGSGYYFINPFASCVPAPKTSTSADLAHSESEQNQVATNIQLAIPTGKISLKARTLNNNKQKINDKLGNPIMISIVVIWRVTDTVKAMFDVDNFLDYLSIQCDSALRNIVRMYPYDAEDSEDTNEKSLRGSSLEISSKLAQEIQEKVDVAGLEIMEARITHLAYAPEIAAAMLQRQQASAIVDARQLIVEGAVGMVDMALEKLKDQGVVDLDEERKAAMVSNLMVVLCANREAQPVVNSGSIY